MLVYQVLPRLWGRGKFSDWDIREFEYLKSLGVSHIWFTGIPRHATGASFVKGDPGSPYSITDWFDVNPYLADDPDNRLAEFEALVSRVHQSGLKVITDFIPNHVAKDYQGKLSVHQWCDYDWTDTLKIDYSDPGTTPGMTEILRFWASKGVDGFRCDMVELVPCEALTAMISSVKSEYPELVFIAEVYDRSNYGKYIGTAGFDLLYDKSGAYDCLMSVLRGAGTGCLTGNWQFLGGLQPRMLNFLENHDEERLQAPDYAALAYASLFNQASFLLYFGQEVDERAEESADRRTSIFNCVHLPSIDRLIRYIRTGKGLGVNEKRTLERHREILRLASEIRDWSNYDLQYCNDGSVFPFIRYRRDDASGDSRAYLIACNFSAEDRTADIFIPDEALHAAHISTPLFKVVVPAHDCCILSC